MRGKPIIDRVYPGAKFGRWTVIGRVTLHDQDGKNLKIRCRCVCGIEQFVKVENLGTYFMRLHPNYGCNKKKCQNAYRQSQSEDV